MKFKAGNPGRSGESPDDSPRLPRFVLDFLEHGAPEGSRNDVLHKCAQQYFWNDFPIDQARQELTPAALRSGLQSLEIATTISSAYRSRPGEPIRGRAAPAPAAARIPVRCDFRRALAAAFEPDEFVAVCDAELREGKWGPRKPVIRTRREWEEFVAKMPISKYILGEGGGFIAINPLATREGGRKNANIAAFRHVLVEFDNLPKDEQRRKLEVSGFPISVMVDSGGKSIHGWVRVDAKDEAEWKARRDHIFNTLGCDPKNKDLARVSRCPGAMRGRNKQALLAVNIGPQKWVGGDGLPAIERLDEFLETAPDRPLAIIEKVLYPKLKMILAGSSKARKSWALLDMCLCVANGLPWMGLKTNPGRVLYINFELERWMAKERLQQIVKARGMTKGGDVGLWNLRGHSAPFEVLIPRMVQQIMADGQPPSLIVIDPFYAGLGDKEENVAEDISALMNELEKFAKQVGAAIVIAHHFSKGDPWDKLPMDRLAGSGVFARAADSLIVMTAGRKAKNDKDSRDGVLPAADLETLFFVDLILRADRVDPFMARWKGEFFAAEPMPASTIYHLVDENTQNLKEAAKSLPPLSKDAAIEWLREKTGLAHSVVVKAWESLRKGRRDLLIYDRERDVWHGVNYSPNKHA